MKAQDVIRPVARAGRTLVDGVTEVWGVTCEKAESALSDGERMVQRHPSLSVMMSYGVGLLAGAALGWVIARETRQPGLWEVLRFWQSRN